MKVEDLMAPAVVVVDSDAPVREAKELMKSHRIHALPVVDAYNKAIGVVTSADVLKECPPNLPVSRIMTPHVVTVSRRADVASAARAMRKNQMHHLVVIQAGRVAGILSSFDLLQLLEKRPVAKAGRPKKRP